MQFALTAAFADEGAYAGQDGRRVFSLLGDFAGGFTAGLGSQRLSVRAQQHTLCVVSDGGKRLVELVCKRGRKLAEYRQAREMFGLFLAFAHALLEGQPLIQGRVQCAGALPYPLLHPQGVGEPKQQGCKRRDDP